VLNCDFKIANCDPDMINLPGFVSYRRVHWIILKTAVAGLETAHLPKSTSSFELSVLTLTDFGELSRVVPGLRSRQVQNTLCF
jgi:hypothetical protein